MEELILCIRDYTELYLRDTGSVGKVGVAAGTRSCYTRE